MAQGICSVEGCEAVGRLARTFCMTHYARWRKYGHTDDPTPPTMEERWWAKVDKNGPLPERRPELGPCWVWTGYVRPDGYGELQEELPTLGGTGRRRRKHLAHRWGYRTFVGPFDELLEIDHLCRNRACVRFDHLEPVTHQENQRRGDTLGGLNSRKTSCKRGHGFSPENTRTSRAGKRYCITCQRERDANRDRSQEGHLVLL